MTSDTTDDPLATGGGFNLLSEMQAEQRDRMVGRQLGDYEITALVAEGGMGRVYRATRSDGSFEREVAIKVSPVSGIDDRARELFLQEQRVLAGMNHPNISQLFDAGVTEEGWPYIVMELIDGAPITEYAEAQALSQDARTRLLIDVADAVAHAHAKLVVHRDLKPSNILVDKDGRVKLLDFGIAKLIDTSGEAVTRERPLTPRYASPEQLLGQPVSVASDIYQLGLLIYEVLTGAPIKRGTTLTDAIQAAASGEEISLTASQQQQLPYDVRRIVGHALRGDPDARYHGAAALRDDLRSYREGYPISIAGSGTGYRMAKFLRRNWLPVGTAAVALIGLTVATAWYTVGLAAARDEAQSQAERAAKEAESAKRAQQETAASVRFFKEVFRSVSIDTRPLEDITVREMLEAGAARANEVVPEEPFVRVPALNELAGLYYEFGMLDVAGELADLSRRAAVDSDAAPWDIDQADNIKQVVLTVSHQPNAALEVNEARWERIQQFAGSGERWVSVRKMAISTSLANGHRTLGNFDESRRWLETALLETDALDSNPDYHVNLINTLAIMSDEQREFEAARAYYDEALTLAREKLGERHVWVGQLFLNLGIHHEWQTQFDEALDFYEQAAPIWEAIYGTESAKYADILQAKASAQWLKGDLEAASASADAALALRERLPGTAGPELGEFIVKVAGLHREFGRLEDSAAAYSRAIDVIGDEGYYLSRYWARLGASDTAQHRGRFDSAEAHLQVASELADANWDADDLRRARLHAGQAVQAWGRDDADAARALWGRVERHAETLPGLNEINLYLAARRYFNYLAANGMEAEIDLIVARNPDFRRAL